MAAGFRVTRAHVAERGRPLIASRGQRLACERRPTEWTGWLWCTDAAGVSGWVPESWLALDGTAGTAVRDYDATELSVSPGEELTGILTESGWLLARTAAGTRGWVPLACVEEVAGDDASG